MLINKKYLNKLAVKTIDVAELDKATDICKIMKAYDIKKYCYQIIYKGIVLKYGKSADKCRVHGERLYRQIGNCNGWDKKLTGPSGEEWRDIEKRFKKMYGFPVDKDYVKIRIWNLTDYPFVSIDTNTEITAIEGFLIEQYINAVGEPPIGNLRDEHVAIRKSFIPEKLFKNLFETQKVINDIKPKLSRVRSRIKSTKR
jgi:hypothetical protein